MRDEKAAPKGRAAGRYYALATERDPFLNRGREAARLTIPGLLPRDGHTGSSDIEQQYQSIGSRGVNNLASKFVLGMFPPGTAFYRYQLDDATLAELSTSGDGEELRGELERALSRREGITMARVDATDRSIFVELMRQLIVAGNVTLFRDPKEKKSRLFRLDSYVVRRDAAGNWVEWIGVEKIAWAALPDDLRAALKEDVKYAAKGDDDQLTLYHAIKRRDDGFYHYHQEVDDFMVPGSEGRFRPDEVPALPLRFSAIPGESYGRGYVEEYYGDLLSLEELSKALVEGAAVAAKVVFLVNPNGTTKAKALRDAPNGGFVSGNANEVTALQVDKQADLAVARQTAEAIEQRLSFAFLLNTAVQRNAERVTAEEIRFVAQELEDALGGIYSLLSVELQLPYVKLIEAELRREGKLRALPDETVNLTIVTGLAALGRGQDLNKLRAFSTTLVEMIGPQELVRRVNVDDLINRVAAAVGLNPTGLIRSPEELAAEEASAANQQALRDAAVAAAPTAMRSVSMAPQAEGEV
ncbi:MAG: head-tail connector protein [Armatimonadetes bacterium]|nr:head-tail connector protein [Armatimonadota bacterium]